MLGTVRFQNANGHLLLVRVDGEHLAFHRQVLHSVGEGFKQAAGHLHLGAENVDAAGRAEKTGENTKVLLAHRHAREDRVDADFLVGSREAVVLDEAGDGRFQREDRLVFFQLPQDGFIDQVARLIAGEQLAAELREIG